MDDFEHIYVTGGGQVTMYLYLIGIIVTIGYFAEEAEGFKRTMAVLFASVLWPFTLGIILSKIMAEKEDK